MDVKKFLTENRIQRIHDVVAQRQFGITVVLENIHDPHNIAAVLRSCDAVGIHEIYVILSDERIDKSKYEAKNNTTSSGSQKWVEVHVYHDVVSCVKDLRKRYKTLMGTHLSKAAKSLYSLDLTESIALVFGNEHEGLSTELLEHIDGNFIIPQYGMVQSLNISVACAVSVFEAARQRSLKNMYNDDSSFVQERDLLTTLYYKKSKPKLTKE